MQREGGKGHPTRNIGTTRWAPARAALPSAAVIQPPACQSSHAAHLRNTTHHGPLRTKPRNKHSKPAWNFLLTGALFFFLDPFEHLCLPPALISSGHDATVASEPFWQHRGSRSGRDKGGLLFKRDLLADQHKVSGGPSQRCCSFLSHSSFQLVINHIQNHSPCISSGGNGFIVWV